MDKFFTWANVHRGPLTSFLGVVIVVASLLSVFTHGRTWSEAAAGMMVGLTLLGVKDPTTGAGTGVVGVVGIMTVLALGGCANTRRVASSYATLDPRQPTVVSLLDTLRLPVTLSTKADSLSASFSLDSLADSPSGQVIKLVSNGGQATVKVWKSPVQKVGGSQRLNVRVDVPPRVLHDTIYQVRTVYGKLPPGYSIKAPPTFWERVSTHYHAFCTSLVSISLVVLLILGFFKYRPWRLLSLLLVLSVGSAGLESCRTTQHIEPTKYRPAKLPPTIYRNLHRN